MEWDEKLMQLALIQAKEAESKGEVPIGAILVLEDKIIAKAYNQVELLQDATAHAEMLVITAASEALGSKYLTDCTLYTTLEPCPMCAGAMKWAKIKRLVYGAEDPKGGFSLFGRNLLHPKTSVSFGIFKQESEQILTHFFKTKR